MACGHDRDSIVFGGFVRSCAPVRNENPRESGLPDNSFLRLPRSAALHRDRFPTQAVGRVALRVRLGGHHVPEEDVRRRFDRSRRHFLEDYLPLADKWVLWDNRFPPPRQIAVSDTHTPAQFQAMLNSNEVQEAPPRAMSEMSKIGLEAGRVATEKMLDYYRRMGIRVTPEMTLAPEKPKRTRRKA